MSFEEKFNTLIKDLKEKQISIQEKNPGENKTKQEYLCTCNICNYNFELTYQHIIRQKQIICSKCASINPDSQFNNLAGVIYKITFPNGKIYIGQTIQKPSIARFKSHLKDALNEKHPEYYTPVGRAIRKYKQLNEEVKYEIIENNIPWHQLDEKEINFIKILNSTNPDIRIQSFRRRKIQQIKRYKSKRKL